MIKIEYSRVYNIKDAMRGMRNPKNSWAKNDTITKCDPNDGNVVYLEIGDNDKNLAQRLIKAGKEHRKFLRQIFVSADFVMPNYISNEFDTYKLGTTRNSCSIQHKGSERDFVKEDFSFDDMESEDVEKALELVNKYRRLYVESKNYDHFRKMRQYLPSSYNYRFTWTGNYEILLNIYKQRKTHLLKEWHDICDWIKNLPGMDVFLID